MCQLNECNGSLLLSNPDVASQYAFSFCEDYMGGGRFASCRESYGDAEGMMLHITNVGGTFHGNDSATGCIHPDNAELDHLELHGPADQLDIIKNSDLKDLPWTYFVTEWGFRNETKVTTASKPELIYFDGPGRAELARQAFKIGEVDFADTRHSFEAWPSVKADESSIPAQCFGSMPCIHDGDLLLAQSQACAVYAAEVGIYQQGVLGDTPGLNRAIDLMVLGAHADLQSAMYACLFGSDESKAAGLEALPDKIKPLLAGLERMLGRTEGVFFFSAGKPSLGDLAVYNAIKSPFPGLEALGQDTSSYTKITELVQAVGKYFEASAVVV